MPHISVSALLQGRGSSHEFPTRSLHIDLSFSARHVVTPHVSEEPLFCSGLSHCRYSNPGMSLLIVMVGRVGLGGYKYPPFLPRS
jgi:hypothetical protein